MEKNESLRTIYIYSDWAGINGPLLMGVLNSILIRGKEVFSFRYDANWLRNTKSLMIDPDLQFLPGIYYLDNQEKRNFGLFLDSSPDRWGRVLMQRREAAIARLEGRKPRKLFETDYLLGVFDMHRMGGIRMKSNERGPFLSDDRQFTTPPFTSIRELEQISLRLEGDHAVENPEYVKWINMLIAPGTSLGGARPKANIKDDKGDLWIAKFPSKNDTCDTGAWEFVAYQLAIQSGINMSQCLARRFSTDHHTFITKRFDRRDGGERIHFASAMTLLGYRDGQDHKEGISYLELAYFIQSNGSNVDFDLQELWRRIVFNICISNVDDHLRNHGFLLSQHGWELSPAYDINPVEYGVGLKLNISEDDNALDLELAMDVHEFFRLKSKKAKQIISEVQSAVLNWRHIANQIGITRNDQEIKQMAFDQAGKKIK